MVKHFPIWIEMSRSSGWKKYNIKAIVVLLSSLLLASKMAADCSAIHRDKHLYMH